ncbi:MAG: NTP transferase domain-containing protein [Aquihabitans sp.]
MRVAGAVLAGGASRRMGRPKALEPVDGVPMARRAAAALIAAGIAPVVLVGGEPPWANALDLPLVADRWPGVGPVGGIATALLEAPAGVDAVVVVACDQPWLQPHDLVRLAAALADDPTLDVVVGRTVDRFRQPFPSAWRLAIGPVLASSVEAGQCRLLTVLDGLSVGEVVVDPGSMIDVDEPGDLPSS